MVEKILLDTTRGILLNAREGLNYFGDFFAYTNCEWDAGKGKKESLFLYEVTGIVNRKAVKKGDRIEIDIFSNDEIEIKVDRKKGLFFYKRVFEYQGKNVKYNFSTERLRAAN